MMENLFSIVNFAWSLLIIGVFIWSIYIFIAITRSTKWQKDYEKYIGQYGLNSPETRNKILLDTPILSSEDLDCYLKQEEESDYKEIEICTKFINQHPKNLYARDRRASLYSMRKNYDKAIKDYNFLMKKEPKNFFHVTDCARMYAYKNNLNRALNLINNFYRNKKKDAEYFSALGKIFEIVKNYKVAIKNYSEAIKLNPNNEFYYSDRADIYRLIGDEDNYQRDKEKYNQIMSIPYDKRKNIKPPVSIPKEFYKNPIIIYKIAILLVVSLAIFYFHPTKEIMQCNHNLTCNIEKTYFGVFKINKEIKLKPYSKLSCSIKACSRGRRHTNYGLYLKYDGIAPFVFFVKSSFFSNYNDQYEELNRTCFLYEEEFENYINSNGKNQYKIKSQADGFSLIFCFAIIALLVYVLFFMFL